MRKGMLISANFIEKDSLMFKKTLTKILLIALTFVTCHSNAALITQINAPNEFLSLQTVLDFEELSGYYELGKPALYEGVNELYEELGVNISNVGSAPVPALNWGERLGRTTSSGTMVIGTISSFRFDGPQFSNSLDLQFKGGVTEVGAYFGNDLFTNFTKQTLSVFDIDNNLLGSVFMTPNLNTSVDQFIGLRSNVSIHKAVFENDAINILSVVLDDISFSKLVPVPEPSIFSIIMLSFIGFFIRAKVKS